MRTPSLSPEEKKQRRNKWQRSYRKETRKQQKVYRETALPKTRDALLQKRYGLSLKDYESLHKSQDGKCKICKKDSSSAGRGNKLHVDHCHKTNKVRGLLCSSCNTKLGAIEWYLDNTILIDRYLKGAL